LATTGQPAASAVAVSWPSTPKPNGKLLLLTHAASLLSLELERPRELVEAHRGLRSAVLCVLLGGDLPAEVAHRPLRFFGFAPADRLMVVLARKL
jgi:hypothetical protein